MKKLKLNKEDNTPKVDPEMYRTDDKGKAVNYRPVILEPVYTIDEMKIGTVKFFKEEIQFFSGVNERPIISSKYYDEPFPHLEKLITHWEFDQVEATTNTSIENMEKIKKMFESNKVFKAKLKYSNKEGVVRTINMDVILMELGLWSSDMDHDSPPMDIFKIKFLPQNISVS